MSELTYLSLGWGVQSWTIAAMIALGHMPPINLAIHADTTHESTATYDHARTWTPWLAEHGVTVITVTAPSTDIRVADNYNGVFIPAITVDPATGGKGMLSRQCTDRWKIRPIRSKLRELLGHHPKQGDITALIGISFDEWHRMRDSDAKYIVNSYPLVDMRMTRNDCVQWLTAHHLPVPPKSACVFCPFHTQSHWKALKQAGGQDWDYAVAVDEAIRDRRPNHDLFLHRAGQPLPQAVRIPRDFNAEQLEMDMPCDAAVCFT